MPNRLKKVFLVLGLSVALIAGLAGAIYFGMIVPKIKAGRKEGHYLAESGREPIGDFTFETNSGIQHLSSLKGKVVLVDVWASWCPPCVRDIPQLAALKNKYVNQRLEIVALSVDDKGWNDLKPFLQKRPEINYTVAAPHPAVGWHVGTLFNLKPLGEVAVLPTGFVIDLEGRLAGKFVGGSRYQEIEALIDKLLSELSDI